jgi:ribosomal protein S13
MALTSTQTSLCNKLVSDFESVIGPATSALSTVKSEIQAAKSALNSLKGIGFSPSEDITNAANDLESDVNENIPQADEEAIDEINDIVSNCAYFGEDELLKNPTAILKSMSKSAFDKMDELIEAVPLPDFESGKLIDSLINKIANQIPDNPADLGISTSLQKADQLIDCLTSLCGSDFATTAQSYADQVEDLYDQLNIVGDPASPNYGKFDIDKLYDDVSLSVTEKVKMNSVVDSVQNIKSNASSSISSAVDTTKSLRKSALRIL